MEQSAKVYDYLVIGAGSGGISSARRAGSLYGKKVAVFENRVVGGTCVNVGCVPKKVMFNLANFFEDAEAMKDCSISGIENLKLDFKSFKHSRDAYIKRLNGIYLENLKKSNVDYIFGLTKFVGEKVIECEGQRYTAEHILIASGSAPNKAKFEGNELCINSDHIFEMEELPKSMVVVGGGYIGVEIGQIMNALGVKVTQLVRSKVLAQCDQEVVGLLIDNMRKHGLDVQLGINPVKVTKNGNGLTVELSDGNKIDTDKVLLSIGRSPNVEALNLSSTGVKVDETGAVWVDEYQNTNVKGIYAIGDCINNLQLTPVAIRAGRTLVERIFNNRDGFKMSYENVPTVIFSHPPIGIVGHSEETAEQKFGKDNIKVYKSKFTNMFFSLMKNNEMKQGSLFKVICHLEGNGIERVVGIHGIGKGIDEMLQGLAIAVVMGATKDDFDRVVAIHPTASEEFALMDPKIL